MYDRFREDIDRFGRDIRFDHLRDELGRAAHRFDSRGRDYIHQVEDDIRRDVRRDIMHPYRQAEDPRSRCLHGLYKFIGFLLVIMAVAAVLNCVCKKYNVCGKREKEEAPVDEEQKELYAKLAKIKGKNTH